MFKYETNPFVFFLNYLVKNTIIYIDFKNRVDRLVDLGGICLPVPYLNHIPIKINFFSIFELFQLR